MYLDFFKFKKTPFHITPDPDFLFLSRSHKEASASIFYGIETRKGFIAVTGEVGVGKTTILRSYLEGTDPERIRIIYVFNAALSFEKLLRQICSEFGIHSEGRDTAELVDALFHFLIEEYKKDRNVVLIVDEAQNMPVETLERLRMLSNLETSRDKLLQIILVGQPEFDNVLNLPELRQLKQRMAIRSRIEALSAEECDAYINHRLMRASLFHNPVFTRKAQRRIIKESEGIPRTINILCDNALVTAAGYRRKPVDEKIVEEVIRDFRGKRPRSGLWWKLAWAPVLAAFLATGFFVSRNVVKNPEAHAPVKPPVAAKPGAVSPASVLKGKNGPVCVMDYAPAEKKEPVVPVRDPGPKTAAGPLEAVVKPPATEAPGAMKTPPAPEAEKAAANPSVVESVPPAPSAPAASGENTPPAPKPPAIDPARAMPVQLAAKPSQPPSEKPVTVRQGDSVSKLLLGVYGTVNAGMLESFKELNPHIRDINKISVGEKVLLPGGKTP